MKVCPRCGKQLPVSVFGVWTNGKPQHWCGACHRACQQRYYLQPKEYYGKLVRERVE